MYYTIHLPVQLLVLQLPNGHCSTYQDYKVSISSTISPVYDFWVNLVVDKFYVPNQINLETIILKNFMFYSSNNKTIHY